jgi:23S rRNA pseudouridine2605 synthase
MTDSPDKTDNAPDLQSESTETELEGTPKIETPATEAPAAGTLGTEIGIVETEMEDPIGDETDGEAKTAVEPVPGPETGAEIEAAEDAAETKLEAEDAPYAEPASESTLKPEAESETESEPEPEAEPETETDPEFKPKPRPPAKLERLQKILAQAGVASRRKAEEMIEQGRIQVNGKVVTELGTKADAGRDHIRVDGKLLQGAERLRYFVLNKPKGFVTTVKDPEGRPTVMQFFDKMRERLYPVGRLDYMSEGLLLVTNDGELANRLTRAASGVEKTYLVKVAGQPTESELDILRGGVAIERGKPGSDQVRTSPARIRQVRQGDNPWYEVVLIEGRNRELRKMFEEIGHFVEKIRRVGYGPLVLDQEPGNLRELHPDEVDALRKTAEGKARTPKSKELRRRNAMDAAGLPTVLPRPTIHPRPAKPFAPKPFDEGRTATSRPGEFRPKKPFGTGSYSQGPDRPSREARPSRSPQPSGEEFRPAAGRSPDRTSARGPARADDRPRRTSPAGPSKYGSARPAGRPTSGPAKRPFRRDEGEGTFTPRPSRPAWQKDDRPRPTPPPARFGGESTGDSQPGTFRPRPSAARSGRTGAGRSFGAKPTWNKPADRSDRPTFKRPAGPRRESHVPDEDLGPIRPPNLHIEEIPQSEHSSPGRSSAPRSRSDRPSTGRPSAPRSYTERPSTNRPSSGRSSSERPSPFKPSSSRPFSSEGGLPRAFTTSSGKPRAGGARPSSKPGKSGGHSYGAGSGARSGSGSRSIEPRTGSGYRPSPGEKRSYDRLSSGSASRPSRPYTPRTEGASESRVPRTRKFSGSSSSSGTGSSGTGRRGESPRGEGAGYERKTGTGWKPKTRYGPGKSASAGRSKPSPGGASKSGYKGKPSGSGPKRTAPRPGGKRPGGAPGGKKRS